MRGVAGRAEGGVSMLCLHVNFLYPPIPIRTLDWCACVDGREEAGPCGYGATRDEAVTELFELLDEEEA